jgi:hypothetical protein
MSIRSLDPTIFPKLASETCNAAVRSRLRCSRELLFILLLVSLFSLKLQTLSEL